MSMAPKGRASQQKGSDARTNFGSGFIVDDEGLEQEQQLRAHRRLFWAVITLAVEDACKQPMCASFSGNIYIPQPDAQTAIRFLMTEHSDGYFMWLDVDPQHFRRKLIEYMYKPVPKKETTGGQYAMRFSDKQKQNFRHSYEWLYSIQTNNMMRDIFD